MSRLWKFYSVNHTKRNTLHQKELDHVFEQKDIGVILDAELSLVNTFVWQHPEHEQVIWAPYLKKYVVVLEKVQYQARKFVDGFHRLRLLGRLRKLNLPSLVYERTWGDMIKVCKDFYSYDHWTLQTSKCVNKKRDFQLVWKAPKYGSRGQQTNFFYFLTIKTWMNSKNKSWMLRLSTRVRTNKMKRGSTCQLSFMIHR